MGLDFYCGTDKSKELHCTYSYIQVIRYILTKMTIEYLKSISFRTPFQPNPSLAKYFSPCPHDVSQDEEIEYEEQEADFEERKNKLIVFLDKTLNEKQTSISFKGLILPIEYSLWYGKKDFDLNYYLNEFGILGLKHFIVHSDCEGYLSLGECMDLMNLFSRITLFKTPTKEEENMDDEFFDELVELIGTCVDKKTFLVFG